MGIAAWRWNRAVEMGTRMQLLGDTSCQHYRRCDGALVGPPIPTPPLLLGYCEGEPGGVWGAENRQYIGVTKHCSHATMQAPIPSPTCTTVMPRTAGQSSQFLGDRCGESGDRETSEHIGQPACCGERGWAGPELEVMELR